MSGENPNPKLKTWQEISDGIRFHWLRYLLLLVVIVASATWAVMDNIQVKPLQNEIQKMRDEKGQVKPAPVYVFNLQNQQVRLPEMTISMENADSSKKPNQDEIAKLFLQAVTESGKSGIPITINDIAAHVANVRVTETPDRKLIVTSNSVTPVTSVITGYSFITFGRGWKFTPQGVAPIQPTEPKK
jgi:hypothetical protein